MKSALLTPAWVRGAASSCPGREPGDSGAHCGGQDSGGHADGGGAGSVVEETARDASPGCEVGRRVEELRLVVGELPAAWVTHAGLGVGQLLEPAPAHFRGRTGGGLGSCSTSRDARYGPKPVCEVECEV